MVVLGLTMCIFNLSIIRRLAVFDLSMDLNFVWIYICRANPKL